MAVLLSAVFYAPIVNSSYAKSSIRSVYASSCVVSGFMFVIKDSSDLYEDVSCKIPNSRQQSLLSAHLFLVLGSFLHWVLQLKDQ